MVVVLNHKKKREPQEEIHASLLLATTAKDTQDQTRHAQSGIHFVIVLSVFCLASHGLLNSILPLVHIFS